MLRSHRALHLRVWIAIAVVVPLICGYALVTRTAPPTVAPASPRWDHR
ncbi:MAG: hypothetical protein IPM29_28850 [Planctomycetes bacterium]|nr:hypothetical protein [Planctomycetota bacterium]